MLDLIPYFRTAFFFANLPLWSQFGNITVAMFPYRKRKEEEGKHNEITDSFIFSNMTRSRFYF